MKIYTIWVAWERLLQLNYNIPPLGILRICGITPEKHEISFTDEMVEPVDLGTDADIVALSFLTPAAPHAYELAKEFRSRGKYVVFGGIHSSIMTDEAREHCDTIFVGESEAVWLKFLEDFENGSPGEIYRQDDLPKLDNLPIIRRDVLASNQYPFKNTPVEHGVESIELSRGCSSTCAYCVVPRIQGSSFRQIPLEDIEHEFDRIRQSAGFIFFVDNNLLGNIEQTKTALKSLVDYRKFWFGMLAPEDVPKDQEVFDLMVESGLCGIYGTIKAITDRDDPDTIKRRIEHLQKLKDKKIILLGTFALGWDDHDPGVFERTVQFCKDAGLMVPEFIINTPFPGSKLYERYEEQGRILTKDWSKYNGNHCVYQPKQMTPEQLEQGYRDCYEMFYDEYDRDENLEFELLRWVNKSMKRAKKKNIILEK
jgi:radical SAM superfamily enzyme YgiQ (UPF0313 family)